MSICTIQVFTAFQALAGIEQRIYPLNSKFFDSKLSDGNSWRQYANAGRSHRLSENPKIGLKTSFFLVQMFTFQRPPGMPNLVHGLRQFESIFVGWKLALGGFVYTR
ncbi:hypothetical protein [Nostoc flagelliforme]|uniref:hypothetical protein n=1 Tax=Nostoc flagelliforme TaxID=1306274 RepID=UPI000C2D231E